jgi:CDP-diacylglycerol--serine O-phosphatidyltransferase
MKSHIPNFITCLNLLCGCVAIVLIFNKKIDLAAWLIAGSLVFDFLDGFAARRLHAGSLIGKELDSLADMVSFGFVPGLLGCHLCLASPPMSLDPTRLDYLFIGYFPLIITLASAIRLARFNTDSRQTDSFIGVPTPAITIFMIGLTLVVEHDTFSLTPTILNPFFICGLSMVLAWLLNSELPMIALKFKSFSFSENSYQYLLIAISALSLLTLGIVGIPFTIILYIIVSIIKSPKNPNII